MESQVREVLSRVLTDEGFLDQMLTDPAEALRPYDLSEEERSILVNPDRDLLELMRIGGGNAPGFNLDVTIIISIILDLSLDITMDLTLPIRADAVERLQQEHKSQIASLATTVLAARSGADRLERIQQLLQTVSGATELASRSAGRSGQENG